MYQNQYNIFLTSAAIMMFYMPNSIIDRESYYSMYPSISMEQLYNKSGAMMSFYPHSTDNYVRTQYKEQRIDQKSKEMQRRFLAMNHSFMRYSEGFPAEKQGHFSLMANALCKLDFKDNVSSYNKDDDSIDTVLKLSNGLTLSISCFVDEDEDAPMVFSIHRGTTLLVSDELPVEEIVRKINSVPA